MINTRAKYILDISDFAIICVIFASVAVGDILDIMLWGNVLRAMSICMAAFHYGRTMYMYRDEPKYIWQKFSVFALIFIVIGACIDILTLDKRFLQSISDMVTTVKIPHCSGSFFEIAVMLLAIGIITRKAEVFTRRKPLWIAIAVLMLAIPKVVPAEAIGYPLLGVFFGCDTFKCVAALPAMGFMLAGIYSCSEEWLTERKLGIGALILTIVSCGMFMTPLRVIAIYTMNAVVVYVACVVCPKLGFFKFLLGIYNAVAGFVVRCLCGIVRRFQEGGKRNLPVYILVYTVVFSVVSFFVFSLFRETGTTIVWKPDAIAQYVPKAYYYSAYMRDAIAQILSGSFNIPDYDFALGLGGAISLSYEPLYAIFALFPPEKVELAYQVVFIIRYYFAGLSASVLFLYYNRKYFESMMGSFIYVFSGFAIAEGVRHAHFLAPMIFLPLLILMTEEIIRKRRWWLCPILIAMSLMNGYYFHYINTLIIGVYYLVRYATLKEKSIKDFAVTTVKFAGLYILGVVIGNTPLTTTFASFLGSSRSGSTVISTGSLVFYSKSWIKKCLAAFISLPNSPGYLVRFGFAAIALIAIVVMLMRRKENKFFATLFVIMTLMCMFPVIGFISNGFSAVINRWVFGYALMVAGITVYMLPQFHTLTRKELRTLLIVFVPYCMYLVIDREFRNPANIFAISMLFASYAVIVLMNQEIRIITVRAGKVLLAGICCLSICFNGYSQYLEGEDTMMDSFVEKGRVISEICDNPVAAFPDEIDYANGIERVASPELGTKSTNSARLLRYYGVTEYSNTLGGNIVNFLGVMGSSTQSVVRLNGFHNRTMLNALTNIKYYATNADDTLPMPYGCEQTGTEYDKANDETYIKYENTKGLPFGYTYDSVISEDSLLEYDTVKRQEVLMQAATVKNADESTASGIELRNQTGISTNTKKLKITDYEIEGPAKLESDALYIYGPKVTVKLNFKAQPGRELYLRWDGTMLPCMDHRDAAQFVDVTLDNGITQDFTLLPYNNAYYNQVGSYMYHMGYQEDEVQSCELTLKSEDEKISDKDPNIIKIDEFGIYQQVMDGYDGYVEKLSENALENVQIGTDSVTGNITVDKEKLMVISLPYQKGWTAYVDGEKTKIEKANMMFMGIDLKKGTHDIRLEFERPGKKLSHMMTAGGLLVYLAMVVIYNRRRKARA